MVATHPSHRSADLRAIHWRLIPATLRKRTSGNIHHVRNTGRGMDHMRRETSRCLFSIGTIETLRHSKDRFPTARYIHPWCEPHCGQSRWHEWFTYTPHAMPCQSPIRCLEIALAFADTFRRCNAVDEQSLDMRMDASMSRWNVTPLHT